MNDAQNVQTTPLLNPNLLQLFSFFYFQLLT